MIVCLCHPTSDAEIEAHVDDGATSLEEIGRRCGAGTGCGACRCQIEDMLHEKVTAGGACAGAWAAKPVGSDCSHRPLSIRSRRNASSHSSPTSSRDAAA